MKYSKIVTIAGVLVVLFGAIFGSANLPSGKWLRYIDYSDYQVVIV